MNQNGKQNRSVYIKILVPFLVILACCAALFASTYAWFTVSLKNEIAPIRSAVYRLRIVQDAAGKEVGSSIEISKPEIFSLTAGTSDDAASTGYCKVIVGEDVYYTDQIAKGETLQLTIVTDGSITVQFEPQIGTSSRKAEGSEDLYGGEKEIVIQQHAEDEEASVPAETDSTEVTVPPEDSTVPQETAVNPEPTDETAEIPDTEVTEQTVPEETEEVPETVVTEQTVPEETEEVPETEAAEQTEPEEQGPASEPTVPENSENIPAETETQNLCAENTDF